jgi:hypothetical protein
MLDRSPVMDASDLRNWPHPAFCSCGTSAPVHQYTWGNCMI